DFTRERNRYTSIFGYPDGTALQKFMDDPAGLKLGIEFDAFIGEHGHTMQMWTPMYRVASLSSP
ncbi:MAG: hypothetical protein ACREQL_14280, partial [Candidatus Binatia bacterium]